MTIPAAIGKIMLKRMSKALISRVQTGEVGVVGSVLRVAKTGETLGYLQETSALSAIPFLANPATAPFAATYLIGKTVHTMFDTQRTAKRIEQGVGRLEGGMERVEQGIGRIENKLDKMDGGIGRIESDLGVLNDLGVANLAVSAAGVGISVAGFAVISAKIDGVRHAVENVASQISAVSAQIEVVRHDMIEADFAVLKTLAEQMDEAWLLGDSSRAERQWHDVARGAHQMQNRFSGRAAYLLAGPDGYEPADPMLDALALASGLRVAALAACNESAAAREAAADGYHSIDSLTGRVGLASLVRRGLDASGIAPASQDWKLALARTSEEFRPIVRKIRDREAVLATRAAPLQSLEERGIAPRDWLRTAHEEKSEQLLIMMRDAAADE